MTAQFQKRCWGLVAGWVLASWVATPALAVPKPDEPRPESPAEKIRRALDQNHTVDFQEGTSLSVAIEQLRNDTKLNIVIDRLMVANLGIDTESTPVSLRLKNVRLRTILKTLLSQLNLTYVIDQEILLITSEEAAIQRQVRQRVNVDLDNATLEKALQQLSRDTGANIILDPRHGKKVQDTVTLKMEDVPLEVVVRLVAEMTGLRSVRQSNVLFVTSKEVAEELKKQDASVVPNPNGMVPFNGLFQPGVIQGGIGGMGIFNGAGRAVLPFALPADPAVPAEAPAVPPDGNGAAPAPPVPPPPPALPMKP
jgi:hypothetical protein